MPPNIVVLVIDGLHAGMVGAYGNAWIHTPQLDRLAAESTVFDQAFVDSPRLDRWYDRLWQAPEPRSGAGLPLVERVRAAGLRTLLLTDAADVAEHRLASLFDEVIQIESPGHEAAPPAPSADGLAACPDADDEPAPDQAESATTIEDTRLAQFFAEANDALVSAEPPCLLWLHTRGLYRPWDAPYALRARHAEPEDPAPPEGTRVPHERLPNDADPDTLLGVMHAYAGQVEALDLLLGTLLDTLDSAALASNTRLVVLSARGFALGEHQRLGLCDAALYNELVQAVLMVRGARTESGHRPDAAVRDSRLVLTSQLSASIVDWVSAGLPEDQAAEPVSTSPLPSALDRQPGPELIAIEGVQGEVGYRTPAWYLRVPGPAEADSRCELFAKPGDRWEFNEVAARAGDLAAQLLAAGRQHEAAPRAVRPDPLPGELVTITD